MNTEFFLTADESEQNKAVFFFYDFRFSSVFLLMDSEFLIFHPTHPKIHPPISLAFTEHLSQTLLTDWFHFIDEEMQF